MYQNYLQLDYEAISASKTNDVYMYVATYVVFFVACVQSKTMI